MSLLLLMRLPFSWLIDTARDLRQAYTAWRTSARSYMRAHSNQQASNCLYTGIAHGTVRPRQYPIRNSADVSSSKQWLCMLDVDVACAVGCSPAAAATAAAAVRCRDAGLCRPCSRPAATHEQASAAQRQGTQPTGAKRMPQFQLGCHVASACLHHACYWSVDTSA